MSKSDAMVSLITGCFNGEQFIERAFNSILAQTYNNIELIFVNDGSTDKSLSIATGFSNFFEENGIKFKIINQENKGFYPTFGILEATGKYISTLDIDDYLMPQSIAKRVLFLEENKSYGGVRTNGYEVDEEDLENCTKLFVTDENEKRNEYIFKDLLLGKTNNWAGSYMVRSSILFDYFPDHLVPGNRFGQNLQILMPVAYQNRIGFIDEPLMKYIRNSQSFTISNHTFENRINQYEGFRDIRFEMLDFLNIYSKDLIHQVNQLYTTLFLNTSYNFNKQQEYNFYYAQVENKTISVKIRYHLINKNIIRAYLYRIYNKLLLIYTNFFSL